MVVTDVVHVVLRPVCIDVVLCPDVPVAEILFPVVGVPSELVPCPGDSKKYNEIYIYAYVHMTH